jgi:hypothetical protein
MGRNTWTKTLGLGAAGTAALCLGGCGSGPAEHAAPPPTLPRTLATALAARSDACLGLCWNRFRRA